MQRSLKALQKTRDDVDPPRPSVLILWPFTSGWVATREHAREPQSL